MQISLHAVERRVNLFIATMSLENDQQKSEIWTP